MAHDYRFEMDLVDFDKDEARDIFRKEAESYEEAVQVDDVIYSIDDVDLRQDEDGVWIVAYYLGDEIEQSAGPVSQGKTVKEALEMIFEATALWKGLIGHEPGEEEIDDILD